TSVVFNDAATQTVVTLANGQVTTSTYNKAGDLVSSTAASDFSPAGKSQFLYDKLGRIRVARNYWGTGTTEFYNSYYLYDAAGRKTADISHSGDVVEYRYDNANRIIGQVAYNGRLNATQLLALSSAANYNGYSTTIGSIRPAAQALDIWTWNIYDAGGRLLQTIDGLGGVTAFEYDTSDRLIKTTSYVNRLAQAAVDGFKAVSPLTVQAVTADAGRDQVSRVFYDRDGRLIGNLNGEGYVTRILYDKAGQKVQEIAYASATNTKAGVAAVDRASATFTALLATIASSANDRDTRYVYDGQGQLRYMRNVLGQVTSYQYDVNGNVTSVTQHNNIASPANYNLATVKAAVTAHANDRTSWNIYDNRDRLVYSIDAAGTVSHLTYDTVGQVTKSVIYAAAQATSSLPSFADMNSWAAGQAGNAGNRVTRNWYTQKGELRYSQDAEGFVTGYNYDALSQNVIKSKWANIASTADTTTIPNLDSLILGAGPAVTNRYSYDYAGRLLTSTDAEGVRSSNVYNALGQISDAYIADQRNGVISADLTITHYEYDGAGRMVKQSDAYGQAEVTDMQYTYDGLGNLTSVIDANGKVTSYTYDRLGRMVTMTDAAGGVTSYEY
ncbi:hypothetical protein ACFOWX_13350, partial [Sphingorhabdus arenilitoris]